MTTNCDNVEGHSYPVHCTDSYEMSNDGRNSSRHEQEMAPLKIPLQLLSQENII